MIDDGHTDVTRSSDCPIEAVQDVSTAVGPTRRDDRMAELPANANRRHVIQSLAAGAVVGLLGWQASDAAPKRRTRKPHKPKRPRQEPQDTRPVTLRNESEPSSQALKVMTRNLYLGADLGPVLRATTADGLVAAATQVFAMVQATNFPERAKALAAEIAAVHPHIVGVQEATLWRGQTPADFSPRPNAQDIDYDFLATLLAELAKQGTHYHAVATVQNADAEVPRAVAGGLRDTRYTDRDVLLARTDLPSHVFSVGNVQSANFAATLRLPNPVIGVVTIPRGWTAVDVTLQERTVRVVSTHLEPLHPGIQGAQGNELLRGPLQTSLPVVLVGDLNSDATGSGTSGEHDTPTYKTMIEAGFLDAWAATRGDDPGLTWGQAEDLRNPTPHLTERIDFILTRGGIDASSTNRIGEAPEDRTPSGLWPSDHAGVWAVLH